MGVKRMYAVWAMNREIKGIIPDSFMNHWGLRASPQTAYMNNWRLRASPQTAYMNHWGLRASSQTAYINDWRLYILPGVIILMAPQIGPSGKELQGAAVTLCSRAPCLP